MPVRGIVMKVSIVLSIRYSDISTVNKLLLHFQDFNPTSLPQMCKWNGFTIDSVRGRLQRLNAQSGKFLPLQWGWNREHAEGLSCDADGGCSK
jgi:hypothetical protein